MRQADSGAKPAAVEDEFAENPAASAASEAQNAVGVLLVEPRG